MTERFVRGIGTASWFVPLLWVVSWSLFRGVYAHGGYLWWETVHVYGGLALLVAGLGARTFAWRRHRIGDRRSVIAFAASQAALVAVVISAGWLGFQTGLAYHCPPTSVGEFLWQDP